jgi:hypothetical protein
MSDEPQKARDVARETAWKHFDLHAKQRIEVFKSYLTLSAVIFAGYGVAFQMKLYGVGIASSSFLDPNCSAILVARSTHSRPY